MKDKIKRINELAKKDKNQGLNNGEKLEQARLRKEYIEAFRGNLKDTLMNVKVVDPLGQDVTPKKLLREQSQKKN